MTNNVHAPMNKGLNYVRQKQIELQTKIDKAILSWKLQHPSIRSSQIQQAENH